MDCDGCREVLSAHLDGEATPTEEAAAAFHLAECADCRRVEASTVEVTRRLRLRPVGPAPDLTDRILGRIAGASGAVPSPEAPVVAHLVPASRCGCRPACACGCQEGRACRCGAGGCAHGAA